MVRLRAQDGCLARHGPRGRPRGVRGPDDVRPGRRSPLLTRRPARPPAGPLSLARALSKFGVCSRTEAARWIEAGRVQRGRRAWCARPAGASTPARPRGGGRCAGARPAREHVVLALHKPPGYVTTRREPGGRPTVYDLLGDVGQWVFPVGRLDRDTAGLLDPDQRPSPGPGADRSRAPRAASTYHARVRGVPAGGGAARAARGRGAGGRHPLPAGASVRALGGRRTAAAVAGDRPHRRQEPPGAPHVRRGGARGAGARRACASAAFALGEIPAAAGAGWRRTRSSACAAADPHVRARARARPFQQVRGDGVAARIQVPHRFEGHVTEAQPAFPIGRGQVDRPRPRRQRRAAAGPARPASRAGRSRGSDAGPAGSARRAATVTRATSCTRRTLRRAGRLLVAQHVGLPPLPGGRPGAARGAAASAAAASARAATGPRRAQWERRRWSRRRTSWSPLSAKNGLGWRSS